MPTNHNQLLKKLIKEVETLKDHKCYACGQEFHDEQHSTVLSDKEKLLQDAQESATRLLNEWNTLRNTQIFVIEKPTTHYKTEAEAVRQSTEIDNIKKQIDEKTNEVDSKLRKKN